MSNVKLRRRNFLKTIGILLGGSLVPVKEISAKVYQSTKDKFSFVKVPFIRTDEKNMLKREKNLGLVLQKLFLPIKYV